MTTINRVKDNLSFYLPSLIKIVSGLDLDWAHIDNLFSQKIADRISQSKGETIIVEATIYDIIVEVKKQNSQAIRLLDFLNKLLLELSEVLIDTERKLIKRNIRSFLTTLDKGYLNFVGELAVLNNLMKSKTYQIEGVEIELPNGKTIDFKLRKIADGNFILVEVVNIHLDSNRIETEQGKIRKFLTDRITRKIANKKINLSPDIDFFLIPVLWGAASDLKIYSEYFQENQMNIPNVIEPVSYLTFIDPNNDFFVLHRFGNISNLFKTNNL